MQGASELRGSSSWPAIELGLLHTSHLSANPPTRGGSLSRVRSAGEGDDWLSLPWGLCMNTAHLPSNLILRGSKLAGETAMAFS
jgi:hypothetical protein